MSEFLKTLDPVLAGKIEAIGQKAMLDSSLADSCSALSKLLALLEMVGGARDEALLRYSKVARDAAMFQHQALAQLARAREALDDLVLAANAHLECTDGSEREYLREEIYKAREALSTLQPKGQEAGDGEGKLTPEEAQAEYKKLMHSEAYRRGDHPDHAKTVQRVQKLFEQSFSSLSPFKHGRWGVKIVINPKACINCGHFACICAIREQHVKDCKFRAAATCAVGVECEHGRDVCPICDPCTCTDPTLTSQKEKGQ